MGNSRPVLRSSTLARLCRRGSITGPELRAGVQVARLVEAARPLGPARAGVERIEGSQVSGAACQAVVAREAYRRAIIDLAALCASIGAERGRRRGVVADVVLGVLVFGRAPGALDQSLRLGHGTALLLLRDVLRALAGGRSTPTPDPASGLDGTMRRDHK